MGICLLGYVLLKYNRPDQLCESDCPVSSPIIGQMVILGSELFIRGGLSCPAYSTLGGGSS